MVSVLTTSAVDRVFEPRSDQTKDYKIGVCCFSAKQEALERNRCLARNKNNVSEWGDMSVAHFLIYQCLLRHGVPGDIRRLHRTFRDLPVSIKVGST